MVLPVTGGSINNRNRHCTGIRFIGASSSWRYALPLLFFIGATGIAIQAVRAQSDTVKESDKLLEDILRARAPSKTEAKKQRAAPRAKSPKKRRARKAMPVKARSKFAGRWRMNANCTSGNYVINVNLTAATPSHVAGTTSSTSGFSTKIVGGRVSGNTIRFRRRTSNFLLQVTDTVTGRLSGASRMTGTITGGAGSCTFTASR